MKAAVIAVIAIAVLSIGAVSYARMCGDGPMMRGGYSTEDQKLLDETYSLRKDLHDKMFEFREAMRKGEYQKAESIEKDITGLKTKLEDKTGKQAGRGFGGCRGGSGNCSGPCGGQ